jgi:hypothetical protein
MILVISKAEINHYICGVLCGMLESMTCGGSEPLEGDRFVLVKNWTIKDGKPSNLVVNREQLLEGYNCYAGCSSRPEDTKIASFIEANWERSEQIYRKLRGL